MLSAQAQHLKLFWVESENQSTDKTKLRTSMNRQAIEAETEVWFKQFGSIVISSSLPHQAVFVGLFVCLPFTL